MDNTSDNFKEPPFESDKENSSESQLSKEEKIFISEYLALTQTGIHIRKGVVSIRMFLSAVGNTVLAFTFSELSDSFVIGFPAIISSSNGTDMTAKMMSPTPMGRMYKTILGISAMPPPKFLLTYLMATRPLLKTMPGFFDEARKNQIDLLIQQLQQNLNLMEVRSKETSTKSGPGERQNNENKNSDFDFDFSESAITGPITARKTRYRH